MGMENGAPIEDDLANVAHFHRRGIRYITLAHSKYNQICDSSYHKERRWNGLSPFGREVVREMNRVGIMIDVSHLTDATVRQVTALTSAPVIASHSSCRKFTPGWERNMDDESIRLLARTGGVMQINFGSAFLDEAANRQSIKLWDDLGAFREQNGLDSDHPRVKEFRAEYYRDSPKIYAELSDVVDHIDHVVKLVGIDHVGLGSDFDGVGDSLPPGLKDVSGYPNLIRALLERGYGEGEIRKICGDNLLRVWSEVERIAANS
jgi:membrane dipeptidase